MARALVIYTKANAWSRINVMGKIANYLFWCLSQKLKSHHVIYISFIKPVLGYTDIVLLDISLTVKAATLIFISGCGSAISSAKEGKCGHLLGKG